MIPRSPSLPVAADGAQTARGAPIAHTVRTNRGELAGQSHPEGVPACLLPGAAGDPLPGCWAGVLSLKRGGITYDVVSLLHVGECTYIDSLARAQFNHRKVDGTRMTEFILVVLLSFE